MERGDSREREEIDRVEDEVGTRDDAWEIGLSEVFGDFFNVCLWVDGAYMPCESRGFVDTDIFLVVGLTIEIVCTDGIAISENESSETHASSTGGIITSHTATGNEEAGISYFLLNLGRDILDIAQGEEVIVRWLSFLHSRIIFIGYHPSIVPFLVCVV